ncbi:expressed protein [Phakopsora pachyrhizi]|uniref:Expressed protein n=1 Tax=Phakopsora pachyrhizi TaxID=170000 RepID=A0AAV0ATW9_PHAPC|nr:expressed protein [Phakopsora pachyrhizi]
MFSNNHGACIKKSTNKRPLVNYNSDSESTSGLNKDYKRPLVNYNSDSESTSELNKDDKRLSTNNTRNRYGKNIKQTMQHREKEMMLLFGQKHNLKKMFHFRVPMGTSDPVPHERVFSNLGTYVENHMIVEFFPFEDMLEERKKGWQEFVEFLLYRQNFINDVSKNNSSLISGIMYAEGWRKPHVPNQVFGRYINQNKLNHQMTMKGFSQDEEEAGFMKMGNFLSTVFQEVASGAYDSCKSYLKEQSIPSLSKWIFNQKENYCPDDFSSAITYTINDFCNKAHVDNDTDNWTLIGFIPIKKDGDLAIEDFDVEGGEFVIRDLKVYIDLPKVKGVTLVVLKTNKLKHQTIPSKSTSGLFTRFGFSCQISKNMSITMEKYHSDHYEDKNHSFGNYDDYINKGKRKAA